MNQHPTSTVNIKEEKTAAEKRVEEMEIQPGVEAGTHKAVLPPNRKLVRIMEEGTQPLSGGSSGVQDEGCLLYTSRCV